MRGLSAGSADSCSASSSAVGSGWRESRPISSDANVGRSSVAFSTPKLYIPHPTRNSTMPACSHTPTSVSARIVHSKDARCFNCRRGRVWHDPHWIDGFDQFLPGLGSNETDGRAAGDFPPLPKPLLRLAAAIIVDDIMNDGAVERMRQRCKSSMKQRGNAPGGTLDYSAEGSES